MTSSAVSKAGAAQIDAAAKAVYLAATIAFRRYYRLDNNFRAQSRAPDGKREQSRFMAKR